MLVPPRVAVGAEAGVSADPGPRTGRPRASLPQGAARDPASPLPPPGGRAADDVAERYRRAVEPAVRGIAGVMASVVFFAAAGAVGGRAGPVIASVLVAGPRPDVRANL